MGDPLFDRVDPWSPPDEDGCEACYGDGGDTDFQTGIFIPCKRCDPKGNAEAQAERDRVFGPKCSLCYGKGYHYGHVMSGRCKKCNGTGKA